MKENYAQALKQVLKYEGGYVDHPKDPGGPTNKGVTQAVYDNWRKSQNLSIQSVRAIADSEVAAIYKNLYWDRVSGDLLPSGVDFAVFDFAVNSGVSRAAKMLQSVVGVTQDGQIGPATILATKTYVAMSITNRRLAFMQSLSIWSTFGKGWSARIADVKAQIIALVKQTYCCSYGVVCCKTSIYAWHFLQEDTRMNSLVTNWKTTIPGVITLIGVLFNIWQTKTVDWSTLQAALVAVGLIGAKDYNVTGK